MLAESSRRPREARFCGDKEERRAPAKCSFVGKRRSNGAGREIPNREAIGDYEWSKVCSDVAAKLGFAPVTSFPITPSPLPSSAIGGGRLAFESHIKSKQRPYGRRLLLVAELGFAPVTSFPITSSHLPSSATGGGRLAFESHIKSKQRPCGRRLLLAAELGFAPVTSFPITSSHLPSSATGGGRLAFESHIKSKQRPCGRRLLLAAELGFEPRQYESES